MSRRISREHKKKIIAVKKIPMPKDNTVGSDNLDEKLPNSTQGSYSSGIGESFNIGMGINKDATVAPKIGEKEDSNEVYAQTYPALIDKHLFSKNSLNTIFLIVISVISGFIFLQDNSANKLNSWNDIFWSVQKCSFIWFLFVVYMIYQFVMSCFRKKGGK